VGRLIDAADVENASIIFEESPRANVSRRVIVTHRVAGPYAALAWEIWARKEL
jgi:hypothetical protein